MKYKPEMREEIKRAFPQLEFPEEDIILAYYKKGLLPELQFSVLIYERDNRPYIMTTKLGNSINIPFNLPSILGVLEEKTSEKV